MLDVVHTRAAAFDEAAAETKARRLAATHRQVHERKLLAKEDLLAMQIVKEEYAHWIGLVDVEVAQRVSAIEAGEESEGDGLESEEWDPILTQASVSSMLEVPVPTKRKSDDEMMDLCEVHRKVSAIGITVAYHELTIAHSAIGAKGWCLAPLASLVLATSSARNVLPTTKAVDGMACRACLSLRRRGRVSWQNLK